jgi:hypothetical protein
MIDGWCEWNSILRKYKYQTSALPQSSPRTALRFFFRRMRPSLCPQYIPITQSVVPFPFQSHGTKLFAKRLCEVWWRHDQWKSAMPDVLGYQKIFPS